MLARLLGTARFVPALLAVILGSEFFLHAQPYQYMMDHMFASFGLLAFVALLWALQRPGPATAIGAALATVTLVLIKPQGLVFLAPAYVVVALRGALWWREIHHSRDRAQLLRWHHTAIVWLVLAGVLVVLWLSPYGRAVAAQYQQGSQGWWAAAPPNAEMLFVYACILLSPWIVMALAITLALRMLLRLPRNAAAASGPLYIALAGVASLAWWFTFNTLFTYTVDPRIIAAAMPIGPALVIPLLCRSRLMAATVTSVALALAIANVGIALGQWPPTILRPTDPFANPRVFDVEPQTHEIGLIPLARQLRQTIPAPPRGPHDDPIFVLTIINDEYVEGYAINVALRQLDSSPLPPLVADAAPWGSARFPLAQLPHQHWFLTKDRHKSIDLQGDAATSLYALDALITDPASPVCGRFIRCFDAPIHPQTAGLETITLWQLPAPPSDPEILAALRFVEPRFRGTPGHPAIMQQIQALQAGRGK